MLFKYLIAINYLIQDTTSNAKIEAYQNGMNELSKLTTILSIALITILVLLTISLFKTHKLRQENQRLKKALNQ